MTTPNALHSKKTPKWGTPEEIAIRSRMALGGVIHLDPASSDLFNTTIGALFIFDEITNGLKSDWERVLGSGICVFLNPPGGLVKEFWQKLIQNYAEGIVSKAIWIGFSIEQLCILQDSDLYPLDFSTVIARKRVAFWHEMHECQRCKMVIPDSKINDPELELCTGENFAHAWRSLGLVEGRGPSHSNYITGLGIEREIFSTLFGDLGRIVHGSASIS